MIVRQAGDVIPAVLGPVLSERPPEVEAAGPWQYPTRCPFCDSPIQRLEGEAASFCRNIDRPSGCRGSLQHFVYAVPSSLASMPALSLPVGVDGHGLPVGFQVMAPLLGEDLMVRGVDHARRPR